MSTGALTTTTRAIHSACVDGFHQSSADEHADAPDGEDSDVAATSILRSDELGVLHVAKVQQQWPGNKRAHLAIFSRTSIGSHQR